MDRPPSSFAFAALLTFAAQGARADAGDDETGCTAEIDLHLVDIYLHEPVGGAKVNLAGATGTSDARGHVLFSGLCPGLATAEIAHPAFDVMRMQVPIGQGREIELSLEPAVIDFVVEEKSPPPVDTRSSTTLSGEALDRRRGQPIAEALAAVPGVAQMRTGTGVGKPILRGQFGRRVPILVDGIRHRSQDWGIDHAPELDPEMADRLTVIRGASGVRHGPDAVGGALLVDSPMPLQKPGYSSEARLAGYSNGLGAGLGGRVDAAPEAFPGLSLRIDGGVKRLRSPSTPDYALDNTGETAWTAGITASYAKNDANYQLSFRHFDTEMGVCLCLRVDSPEDFRAQLGRGAPAGSSLYRSDATLDRPYQTVKHELAMARAQYSIGNLGRLTATYALQYDNRDEYDIVRQAVQGPQFSFHLLTQDVDVVVEHYPIHLADNTHLTGAAGVVGMMQTHDFSGLYLVPGHKALGTGVFASERLWGHDYEIEAGLRYDLLSRDAIFLRRDFSRLVRGGQIAENACGTTGADSAKCESLFHTLSASIGGVAHWTEKWSTKLDLSTTTRPPNPDEQYLSGTAPSLPVLGLGKPNASAETTWSASATLAYAGERTTAELSGFANYIDDYLYFAPAIGPDGNPIYDVLIRGTFPRFQTRAVNATFYGADGFISRSLRPWLSISMQASMVRARNVSDGSYLLWIPPDRLRASLDASKSNMLGFRKLSASIAGNYVAHQSRFDPAADLAPPPDGYFMAEAFVGGEFSIGRQNVRLGIQGNNLFGARYREYASLLRYFADQPGRQLMFRITVTQNGS